MVKPGDVVLYRLHEDDVKLINERRAAAGPNNRWSWNPACIGEEYPLIVVRVWPNEFPAGMSWAGRNITGTTGINGQLFLDGNGNHWVTSVPQGIGPGTWTERE